MAKGISFKFSNKVFVYPGAGGWHFVTLSKKDSKTLSKLKTVKKGAWGYIPITATIGKTSWDTGLWPQKESGLYLLSIKASVREKEAIFEGDTVRGSVEIR